MRWLASHLVAMLAGSLIIVMGTDVLEHGWDAALGGAEKWLGGLAIFVVIAVLSAPIGFGLRFALGRLGKLSVLAAVVTGTLAGLVLIPILHPAMYPDLSLATNPIGLLLVHGIAGCVGGLAWFGLERSLTPPRRGTA